MKKYNSKGWLKHIRTLADAVFEVSDKTHVSYDKKILEDIENIYYPESLVALKSEMFGVKGAVRNRIDRHKLVALYIQLFLEKPVFKIPHILNNGPIPTIKTKLINESLCLYIMEVIFSAWSNKKMDRVKFDRKYKAFFLKLLYNYRVQEKLNKGRPFSTFALAHILYFIEQEYFEIRSFRSVIFPKASSQTMSKTHKKKIA